MSWLLSLPMFAVNLAIAATLCLAISLGVSRCFSSLPKRYGLLLTGLIGSLAAPLAVALGAWLSLGLLPAIDVTQAKPSSPVSLATEQETSLAATPVTSRQTSEMTASAGDVRPIMPRPARPVPANFPNASAASHDVTDEPATNAAAEPITGEANASLPWLAIVGLLLVAAWLVGSLIVLCRHVRSWLLCQAFVRSCGEVKDDELRHGVARQCERLGIAAPVRLLESSSLPAPVVVGWLRPAMVLPEEIAFDLTPSQLRRVVAHELSHIQRRDHWTSGAQVAASVLYWWNPLLSLLSRRMNELREMICDDIATSLDANDASQNERTDYAESLVRLAERAVEREAMAGSLGISLSSFTEMERRVRRILTERTGTVELRITRRFMAGLSTLGLLLAVGLAFAQVPGEQKEVATSEEATAQTEVADNANEKKAEKPAETLGTLFGRVVDPSGQPAEAIEVQVTLPLQDKVWEATTDAKGAFQLELPMAKNFMHQIIARSPDGKLMGIYRYQTDDLSAEDVREVTLEPIKAARVHVVNGEGQPVAGAKVAAQIAYPNSVGPLLTDEAGEAVVEIPESDTIVAVVAWKDHVGLDYKSYVLPYQQQVDQLAKKPEFPYDEGETLTLSGASPLTVHVADTDGKPLVDVPTYVWLLKNEKNEEELNLSMLANRFAAKTDASGSVTFDWFPAWQKSEVTIWPHAEGYARARGQYDPVTGKGETEVQLARQMPLRGKVTFPDGKPAAGIDVLAIGAGYSHDDFRGGATTDENGRYEIMVTPNQIYMLTIHDKEWAAPSQSGFAVLPGQEVEEHDFVLSRPTRVHGQVVNTVDGKPLSGQHLYFQQRGIDLQTMGSDILPNPEQSRRWVCPLLQLNKTTGENGEFEFFVGDGDYTLFVSGFSREAEKFTITGEAEKQVDLEIEVSPKVRFTGQVVDDATGKPIAGARIEAVSRNFDTHNSWQAATNDEGTFQVERAPEPTYLRAISADNTLGALTEIKAEDTSVTLRLKRLGSATGRLMTEDGTEPAPGVKMYYGYRVNDVTKTYSSNHFGGRFTTDAEGYFTVDNLVPGYEYECILEEHPSGYVLIPAKATVEPGQTLDLGDCKIPEAPKPYVPPTLEERIQSAFNVDKTPLERLASGKRNVATANQNLLIVFAEPLDPRVHALMKIRWEDEDFRKMSDDFRFLAVPTDAERIEAAQALAKELELPALKETGELLLVVIDHEGDLIAKIGASQICEGETLVKAKLLNELEKYQTTPLDARKLLDDALAQAKREDKRVLVQETATWCGPCHMLSHLLLDHPQWQTDYVWVKMDHRWTGAQEIMKDLRGEASGGIPWFAILDAEGKVLATSNEPEEGRNIGYPSEDWGKKHFAEMLKSTRQRMSDEEIKELVEGAK